jgi:hypothetical protein
LVQDHSNGGHISDDTLLKKRKEKKKSKSDDFFRKSRESRQKNEYVSPFGLLVVFHHKRKDLQRKDWCPLPTAVSSLWLWETGALQVHETSPKEAIWFLDRIFEVIIIYISPY